MVKRQKLALPLGVAISLVALAGCSSAPEPAADVTLSVQDYFSGDGAAIADEVYNACAAEVGVKIDVTHAPSDGYQTKLLQQISSRTLPDVAMVEGAQVPNNAQTGAYAVLTDYGIDGAGIPDGALGYGKLDGKLYAIAPVVNSIALFYRTDLLEAAGLTPPTTWDELMADAAALTKGDQYGFAFSAPATNEGTWQYLPFLWSNGGDETDIQSPQAAEALQYLTDMVKKGYVSQSVLTWGQNDLTEQFVAGNAAMMINGPWIFSALAKAPDLKWGTVSIPTPDGGPTVAPLGGEAFTLPLNADADRMKISAKLLGCIVGPEGQKGFAKNGSGVPTISDVATEALATYPNLAAFAKTIQTARSRTEKLGVDWPNTSIAIYTAIQLALTGQETPEKALEIGAQEIGKG